MFYPSWYVSANGVMLNVQVDFVATCRLIVRLQQSSQTWSVCQPRVHWVVDDAPQIWSLVLVQLQALATEISTSAWIAKQVTRGPENLAPLHGAKWWCQLIACLKAERNQATSRLKNNICHRQSGSFYIRVMFNRWLTPVKACRV